MPKQTSKRHATGNTRDPGGPSSRSKAESIFTRSVDNRQYARVPSRPCRENNWGVDGPHRIYYYPLPPDIVQYSSKGSRGSDKRKSKEPRERDRFRRDFEIGTQSSTYVWRPANQRNPGQAEQRKVRAVRRSKAVQQLKVASKEECSNFEKLSKAAGMAIKVLPRASRDGSGGVEFPKPPPLTAVEGILALPKTQTLYGVRTGFRQQKYSYVSDVWKLRYGEPQPQRTGLPKPPHGNVVGGGQGASSGSQGASSDSQSASSGTQDAFSGDNSNGATSHNEKSSGIDECMDEDMSGGLDSNGDGDDSTSPGQSDPGSSSFSDGGSRKRKATSDAVDDSKDDARSRADVHNDILNPRLRLEAFLSQNDYVQREHRAKIARMTKANKRDDAGNSVFDGHEKNTLGKGSSPPIDDGTEMLLDPSPSLNKGKEIASASQAALTKPTEIEEI